MAPTLSRGRQPVLIGSATVLLLSIVALLVCDAVPRVFPAQSHGVLAPTPLVLAALACLVIPFARRSSAADWAKAVVVALAFLFWAANQICVDPTLASLLNDLAIALFVLDVFLVTVRLEESPA